MVIFMYGYGQPKKGQSPTMTYTKNGIRFTYTSER